MKRLVYLLFAFSFIPAVSKVKDPVKGLVEDELGYIDSTGNYSKITEEDLKEIFTLYTEEELASDIDEEETEDKDTELPSLSSLKPKPIPSDLDSEKQEMITWRKNLPKEDRQLFRRIMQRIRKDKPKGFWLKKPEAEKLLKRIKARKTNQVKKLMEQRESPHQTLS